MEGEEFSPPPLSANKPFTGTKPLAAPRKKKKNNNNRRFTDEQLRSLESMFKLETKLEPRKKLQLARELGLQPRQVAIWFQNRRARWKSKQIEQEYRVLKANYDKLNSQFESLKKEKQTLLVQLQKLNDRLKQPHDRGQGSKDSDGNSTDAGSDNEDTNCEFKVKPSCSSEALEYGAVMYSDDDERGSTRYLAQEEELELLNLGGQVDGSLVPPEKWCNLDSGGLPDHSCGTSNWWDFWT
ncbi:hypothetical protein RJ640_028296 [Escallonia rubra]|uniref:Homeobox-leucine zipper protein n=1 Tax=Escallonia rubra TaxID=112253 RepID=A0AA88S4E9_9ASTE|nr:hypothetical protein RJ640_028296 [Escallonia rubra]